MSQYFLHTKAKFSRLFLSACLVLAGQAVQADSYQCNPATDLIGPSLGTVISPIAVTTANTMLLTPERMANMKQKMETNDPSFVQLINSLNGLLGNEKPYGADHLSSQYALAYRITGNDLYKAKAKSLFKLAYLNDPDFGTRKACGRDAFRSTGRPAVLYYNWMYNELSEEERNEIVTHFAVWGEYWLNYIATKFKPSDSDENTSLAENLTFLALALQGTELGDRLMVAADDMFENVVIKYHLNDLFKGGVWGEGAGYGPATSTHWAMNFIINNEVRHKQYDFDPEDYIHDTILAYNYQILPGYTGTWKNGDTENAEDYFSGPIPKRLQQSMSVFSAATSSSYYKKIANYWKEELNKKVPIKDPETSFFRVLFDEAHLGKLSPQAAGLPLSFSAEGMDYHHFRSSWSDDATAVYITSTDSRVDHGNNDALHFDIARKGRWLTKEISGYSGASNYSLAHNTLLIENYSTYSYAGTGKEGSSNLFPGSPAKDGDILMTASAPNYNYVAADAAGPYSQTSYWYTHHAKHVTRQLANINNDTFIVFDHVITDKYDVRDLSNFKDMVDVTSGEYVREVNYVQHFESEPVLDGEFYSTQEPVSKQQLKYKTLLPVNHTQEIVDEKAYYGKETGLNTPNYAVPLNQRKWRIKITPEERNVENRFLHVMFAGDEGQVATPSQQIVLNKESGYILDDSDDVTGVAMNFNGQWHVVLFNDKPSDAVLSNVSYQTPFINSDADVLHYVLGVNASNYTIDTNNGEFVVTENSTGELQSNQSALYFRTQFDQVIDDTQAPSTPIGLAVDASDKDQLNIVWQAAEDISWDGENVENVAGYHIFRDGTEVATVSTTSYLDSQLTPETDYEYSVSAFDVAGNESAQSSVLLATTQDANYVSPITEIVPINPVTDSGTGSSTNTGSVTIAISDPRIVPLATPVPNIAGVFPAAGSSDVDHLNAELVLQFKATATYKWTGNKALSIHNLDSGEVVYTIDPDETDKQNGLTNYSISLDNNVLQPDTRYGVTTARKFAVVSKGPYWHSHAITEGVWTFKTKALEPEIEEPVIEEGQLDEPASLLSSVYPAPGSTGVAYNNSKIVLTFDAPANYKWTRYAALSIRNLDNGALVYTIDPDESDPQNGLSSYTIDLAEGILKPNTRYGVTSKARFARLQKAPYSLGEIADGQWTFTTRDGESNNVKEAVPLDKAMPLLEGVYPPSGSTDVDPVNTELKLLFSVPATYKWTNNKTLSIHNLDTGEVVYSVDPDESDKQNGLATYTVTLKEGTLAANTRYGVTTASAFARLNASPWISTAITEGMWTFTTK